MLVMGGCDLAYIGSVVPLVECDLAHVMLALGEADCPQPARLRAATSQAGARCRTCRANVQLADGVRKVHGGSGMVDCVKTMDPGSGKHNRGPFFMWRLLRNGHGVTS